MHHTPHYGKFTDVVNTFYRGIIDQKTKTLLKMRSTIYTGGVSEQLPEQARQNVKLLRPIDMQQPTLHFITATLPQELNSTHALSQIRSHVSKESHARRRRALAERLEQYHASSTSAKQQLQARISGGGKEARSTCFPWSLSENELFLFNFCTHHHQNPLSVTS